MGGITGEATLALQRRAQPLQQGIDGTDDHRHLARGTANGDRIQSPGGAVVDLTDGAAQIAHPPAEHQPDQCHHQRQFDQQRQQYPGGDPLGQALADGIVLGHDVPRAALGTQHEHPPAALVEGESEEARPQRRQRLGQRRVRVQQQFAVFAPDLEFQTGFIGMPEVGADRAVHAVLASPDLDEQRLGRDRRPRPRQWAFRQADQYPRRMRQLGVEQFVGLGQAFSIAEPTTDQGGQDDDAAEPEGEQPAQGDHGRSPILSGSSR